jgi:5-formyltetrahydrofolate cyclo-ligase
MTLDKTKQDLRREASERRDVAHKALTNFVDASLLGHAFPVAAKPGHATVSGFYPHQSEIGVLAILGKLAGDGWTPCLPVVQGKNLPLLFRQWYPGEPTIPGLWKIPVPELSRPEVDPDVLLVPMLAFDRSGYRLGYGGGFYDRTLARLRAIKHVTAIGVAYAAQEMGSVPHGDHDQRLDYVMTEREIIACA